MSLGRASLRRSLLLLLLLLVLIINIIQVSCRRTREKGLRLRRINSTQTAPVLEQQYMKWVASFVRNKRHSAGAIRNLLVPGYTITVDRNPSLGDFTTIQAAVDSIPAVNSVRVVIRVNAGVYREKVSISAGRAFVTVEGAGADATVVQWGDTAGTKGADGKPIGTFNSATFAVNSAYFIAKGITFKNTSPVPAAGAEGKQAVALRISGDRAALYSCRILGAQDSLYDHMGSHYYNGCYIQGSVDFVFGNALSFYQGCHLHAIARDLGAVTAQNRMNFLDDTGFSFVGCKLTGSGALLYLGRAWGTFSRVIFAYTYMDNIVLPEAWNNWGDPNREMSVFYGQYKCTGPGASRAGRVAWSRELTDAEAKPFLSMSFIDGSEWIAV